VISCIILSSDRIWPEPRFPNWVPTIIVSRDLLLIFGTIALLLITGRVNCQPTILGKAATFLQIIAVISVLIGNHVPIPALAAIWWMTVAFTFVSGLFYMYRGVKQL
ncbi:MAG: CDP-alcohol phosphatidyltransferase family protein, partial [Planctomycetota bacterium]